MSAPSKDAVVFGLSYLNGPNSTLSFGGEGAKMRITDRARAALNELLTLGYAEPAKPDDQILGREHYRGANKKPHLGSLAQAMGLDVFTRPNDFAWSTFVKVAQA